MPGWLTIISTSGFTASVLDRAVAAATGLL
jgi:hypothetical protein